MLYTSVGFYLSLCAFALNMITNMYPSKDNINPAIKAVP